MQQARARIDARFCQSLAHLKAKGTSTAIVDAFEAFLRAPGTLLRPALVIRCRFVDGAVEHSIVVDNPKSHWRLSKNFLPFLDRLVHRVHGRADVIVLLSDTMYVGAAHIERCTEFFKQVPFLRPDWLEGDPLSSHTLAIPDFTLQEATWAAELHRINEVASSVPFAERRDVVKWRGRLTGPDYPDSQNCHLFTRYHLLKLSATVPETIDARITHYDNFPDTDAGWTLRRELDQLLGGAVPELASSDFVLNKYLISTDGVVSTWKRVANSLWTGSVLLLQHRWKQFFYPGLMAWEHYIPINNDVSDLMEKVAWLNAHPGDAERIGRAGRLFAQQFLTAVAIEEHFVRVINACASLPLAVCHQYDAP